jgi:small subunit ribosomal protein S7
MRRRAAERREVLPDPKFGDVILAKFINSVMLDGKKSVAEASVYAALDKLQQRGGGDPMDHLDGAEAFREDDDGSSGR